MAMAEAFPQSDFVGVDFSAEAIAEATEEAQRRGLPNLEFRMQDAAQLEETNAFGLIT
ncbi:MAG: class I SAM-dependent methyltransferase, partial [Planctomycetota bacterium]